MNLDLIVAILGHYGDTLLNRITVTLSHYGDT